MARTIWKWELPLKRNEIEIPQGAETLHIGSQTVAGRMERDTIVLWAEVDSDAPTERRTFVVYGTGWPLPEDTSDMRFLGTALLYRTSLVYHVYEEVGQPVLPPYAAG